MDPSTSSHLTAAQLRRIDEICNRCEEEWIAGTASPAENWLADATEPFRGALLFELLRIEKHYRKDCTFSEFLRRFPDVDPKSLATMVANATNSDPASHRLPSITGYEITEVLGRGGMGVVYRGRDLQLDRPVAVKMLQGHVQDERSRLRLGSEARAAARLQHPNLVQIYEVGESGGAPFLVFELMEGGTLGDWMHSHPPSPETAALMLESVARGVAFAHSRHVIHRDLKPSNVLLSADRITPKVSDFGLAKRMDETTVQTASGMLLGTPAYMAPEQADAQLGTVGPLSDVYSLGAILYEMITGEPVHRAASVFEILRKLKSDDPLPPRRIKQDVPRDLETICLKALKKNPLERYASAEILADDLRRFQNNEPILARPQSWLEHFRAIVRKHPVPTALSAILSLVVVYSLAMVLSSWREANYQKQIALERLTQVLNAQERLERETERALSSEVVAQQNAILAKEQGAIARKNAELAEEKERVAQRNLTAATLRLNKAQSATQELIRIGNELTKDARFERRGHEILLKAAQFQRGLELDVEQDWTEQFATVVNLVELAKSRLQLNQLSEAVTTYQAAYDWIEQIESVAGSSVVPLREKYFVSLQLATCYALQREHAKCLAAIENSIRIADHLVSQHGGQRADLMRLFSSLDLFTKRQLSFNQRLAARETASRLAEVQRRITQQQPDSRESLFESAEVLDNSAMTLLQILRPAGIRSAEDAFRYRTQIVQESPAERLHMSRFSHSGIALGLARLEDGRPDDARTALKQVEDRLSQWLVDNTADREAILLRLRCLTAMEITERVAGKSDGVRAVRLRLIQTLRDAWNTMNGDRELANRMIDVLEQENEFQMRQGNFTESQNIAWELVGVSARIDGPDRQNQKRGTTVRKELQRLLNTLEGPAFEIEQLDRGVEQRDIQPSAVALVKSIWLRHHDQAEESARLIAIGDEFESKSIKKQVAYDLIRDFATTVAPKDKKTPPAHNVPKANSPTSTLPDSAKDRSDP